MFSYHTDSPPAKMVFATLDKIEELWSPVFWRKWEQNINDHTINLRRSPYDHVEVGAPPVKTKYGWLVIYSHIQNYFNFNGAEKIFGIEDCCLISKILKK